MQDLAGAVGFLARDRTLEHRDGLLRPATGPPSRVWPGSQALGLGGLHPRISLGRRPKAMLVALPRDSCESSCVLGK